VQRDQRAVRGTQPLQVLHVVGAMRRAGAETWLMHILRRINQSEMRFSFAVNSFAPGDFDEEIRTLGGSVEAIGNWRRPWSYRERLLRILQQHGPFDIIHSHVDTYGGFIARTGCEGGVPVRIAHSHNDTRDVDAHASHLRRGYIMIQRRWIHQYSTIEMACSVGAGTALFGERWYADPRAVVVPYGIDLSPFESDVSRAQLRAQVHLPHDALVMAHVGRFERQKNHQLVVEVAAHVMRSTPNAYLLLVGDGILKPRIVERVRALGLEHRTRFLGVRGDVPDLMRGCMDVLLFPSIAEGVPLVLLEAQAAGLRIVCADTISRDVDVLPRLIRRISLSEPPSRWAAAVTEMYPVAAPDQSARLEAIRASKYNIENSARELLQVYRRSMRPIMGSDGRSRQSNLDS
jgi:glycosyltransferase involved in cell wall biosynthesis